MAYARVASATSSTVLLAAGNEREVVIITNSDANRLYVKIGSSEAAAADSHSFSLGENESARLEQYAGEIRGIWSSDGSGYAHITTY